MRQEIAMRCRELYLNSSQIICLHDTFLPLSKLKVLLAFLL
jgi:tRNA splicing ligase